jgi:hypothetical protein
MEKLQDRQHSGIYSQPELRRLGTLADLTRGSGGSKLDGQQPNKAKPPGQG